MHNVEYYEYPSKVDCRKVQNELYAYVARETYGEGGGGLYHPIRWLGSVTYPNREAAEEAIRQKDNGCYDQLAVKFFHYPARKDAKTYELEAKIKEAYAEFNRRERKLYPEQLTSEYIGCKECGSRLSRKHLVRHGSNFCPVCGKDMRPESMLKSIEVSRGRWNRAKDELRKYKEHGKAECRWLVKIEYHT